MGPALPSLLPFVTSVQWPLGSNQWMVGTHSLEEDSASLPALSKQGSTAEVSVGWANVGVSTSEGDLDSSGAARVLPCQAVSLLLQICPCCCPGLAAAG